MEKLLPVGFADFVSGDGYPWELVIESSAHQKLSLCLVIVRLLYYFFLKDLTFLTFFWSADSLFQFLIIVLTLKVWPSPVSFSFPRPSKNFGKLSHKGCFLVYKLGIFKIHITAVYINSNFKYCKKHFQSFTTKQNKVAASPGTIKNSATVDLLVCGTEWLLVYCSSQASGVKIVFMHTQFYHTLLKWFPLVWKRLKNIFGHEITASPWIYNNTSKLIIYIQL